MHPERQRNNQHLRSRLLNLNLNQFLRFPLPLPPLLPLPTVLQPSFAKSKARVSCTQQIPVDSRTQLLSTLTNIKFLLTFSNNLKLFLPLLLLSSLDTLLQPSTLPVLLPSTLMVDTVQCRLQTLPLPLHNFTLLITLLHLLPLPSSSLLALLESRSRLLQETVNLPDRKLKL